MQGPHLRLTLFGRWRLARGDHVVDVPSRSQRLAALLALRGQQARAHLAGVLWPDVPEERAQASLRAALSGVRRHASDLVADGNGDLHLADGVAVDVVEFRRHARSILSGDLSQWPGSVHDPVVSGGELLPGWYDDWLIVERERIHQVRLHVLEALAGHLVERDAYAQALEAALTAVEIDPLRESAQRSLIAVHLAQGNTADAVRQYKRFCALLRAELDVLPTPRMTELIEHATDRAAGRRGRRPGHVVA